MAFLDNSGDIILDAVLTDTGRLRLAQGDGSFKISKFALGDDEINYGLYNKNHPSGSAYFDLEILQTPILEAFTNNSAQVKSRLMTMNRTNVLYMPTLLLNQVNATMLMEAQAGTSTTFSRMATNARDLDGNYSGLTTPVLGGAQNKKRDISARVNSFYVCVDADTQYALSYNRLAGDTSTSDGKMSENIRGGMIQGYHPSDSDATSGAAIADMIRVDQGLNTDQISPTIGMDSDLLETAYIVEMDYRLGRIKDSTLGSTTIAPVNFIDDDNIATYYLTDNTYVNPRPGFEPFAETRNRQDAHDGDNKQIHKGPRGSTLHFRIHASSELQNSTYLFEQLGSSEAIGVGIDSLVTGLQNGDGDATAGTDAAVNGKTTYWIDTTVRVIGANTGSRLDIPVRFIKIK